MAWWPVGRTRREPASDAPPAPPPVLGSARPDGAWRDLPKVQRVLADPLRPVTDSDQFRRSLAAFSDPSFLAPLSHQVEPSSGGVVEGLAAPGQPYGHGGPELPVPPRTPAAPAPRVQRTASWASSPAPREPGLATVSWELPGPLADAPAAASDLVDHAAEEPWTDVAEAAAPPSTLPVPTAGPVGEPTGSTGTTAITAEAPTTAETTAPTMGTSATGRAPLELPVGPRPSMPPVVVSRSATPAAETAGPATVSAPLSSFAAAITRLTEAAPESGPNPAPGESVAHPAPSPAGPVPYPDRATSPRPAALQRLTTAVAPDVEPGPAVRSVPILEVAPVPSVSPSTGVPHPLPASLPVVSRVVGEVAHRAAPPATARRPETEAPTLGSHRDHSSLVIPQTPLTNWSSAAAPAVQRLEYLPAAEPTRAVPRPTTAPVPGRLAGPAETRTVSRSAISPPAAVGTRPANAPPVTGPVQRAAIARPEIPHSDPGPDQHTASTEAGVELVALPMGPGVPTEVWTADAVRPNPAESGSPGANPVPVVSRSALSVGPPVERPGSVGPRTEPGTGGASPVQAPLVVARQVSHASGSTEPGPVGGVSFASMFASAGRGEPGGVAAAQDGFTSVQLDAADGTPTATPAASADPPPAPASGSGAPAPGAPAEATPDLDEMARRLYEPLSARLRAELWLDRERAGVMSDV